MAPKKTIYLDYAAAAPLSSEVEIAMRAYFQDGYANPSSLHTMGVQARRAVEGARSSCANLMGARTDEIIFTSGGTEGNSMIVRGVVEGARERLPRPHVIVSAIEHPSVLETARHLADDGSIELDLLPVDKDGLVILGKLEKLLRAETALVSVMYANNEIGTIQPLEDIARAIRHFRAHLSPPTSHLPPLTFNSYPVLHSDACQAAHYLEINVERLHVDALTLSAAKIYGPKGSGAVYLKRGVTCPPLFFGGGQEFGRRAGTENVPGIVGMAKALELATQTRLAESARLTKLRDAFIAKIARIMPETVLNGHALSRLPNSVNIWFPGREGERMVLELDACGIAAATGSACGSTNVNGSHVIFAISDNPDRARQSVRFSLGRTTTEADLDATVHAVHSILLRLYAVT